MRIWKFEFRILEPAPCYSPKALTGRETFENLSQSFLALTDYDDIDACLGQSFPREE